MKKSNIIVIILGIVINIILILFMIFYGNGMIKQYLEYKEIEDAKQKASEYLDKKYEDNFALVFYSKGYKAREFSIDASTTRCGHERKIKQFVFKVFSKNIPVISYVTVWKNIITNEFEINEVNGVVNNTSNTSYEVISKKYIDKQKIKESLHQKLENNKYYYINYDYKEDEIKIVIKRNLQEVIEKELDNLKYIIKLAEDKSINIIVDFIDDSNRREYKKHTDMDKEIKFLKLANKVNIYMKKNFKLQYSIELMGRNLNVNINEKIKEKYNSKDKKKYIKLFDDLKDLVDKSDAGTITLNFLDHGMTISNYGNLKTIEDFAKYWK